MLLSLLLAVLAPQDMAAVCPPKDTLMGNTCVPRFDYCIVYPAGFVEQPPSANGDGAVALSADGKAEVRTWGQIQLEDDWDMNWYIKDDLKRLKVVYKVIKPTAAILSGTDQKGNIVYEKVVLVDGNFKTLRFTYPAAEQSKYGWYCAYVAKAKMIGGEAFDLHQHTH